MKKHCKLIAVAGMILGIAGMFYMTWLYNSMMWWLLVWVFGCPAIYMVYVMWASLAEILERLERLERKASGNAAGEEMAEPASGVEEKMDREEADEEIVICPRCGNVQQRGGAFCAQCGIPLC